MKVAELGGPIRSPILLGERLWPRPLGPIAANQTDLLNLVLTHDGTITGMMTPECADWLLEMNTGNRNYMKAVAERFCRILQAGLWKNTGEPVIVSREGILNDGQHRLNAIRMTGIAADMDVRFGIARDAFAATGTGVRRSPGHVLSIEGYSCGNTVAAIARWIFHYQGGTLSGSQYTVEPDQVMEVVRRCPVIPQITALILSARLPTLRASWFGAVLTLAASRSSLELATQFCHAVDHGEDSRHGPNSGARRLREKLVIEAMSKAKLRPIDRIILGVKAWNAWVSDRPVMLLRSMEAERSSKGFPEVLGRP